MRWLKLTAGSAAIAAVAVVTSVWLGNSQLREAQRQIAALEHEKAELIEYAERLVASRRVAQIDVLSQSRDEHGVPVTRIRWQEVDGRGTRGTPLELTARGEQVYVEGRVLKFDARLVGEGDPERGLSLTLFRRVFGDRQSPESAAEIDRTARPPTPLETEADRRRAEHHERLWARFWEMTDDPRVAEQYGVRVAQIEAPSVPMKPGQVWEVALDAAGGLNLRRIADTP